MENTFNSSTEGIGAEEIMGNISSVFIIVDSCKPRFDKIDVF